jgi:signal recognition particle subunit SRP54
MFGNFTQKISKFLLNRMKNSKNEEINQFIDELFSELKNILLNEDVHPHLVEKIIEKGREYLNKNKNEIFNKQHLMKNLLKELLGEYIIEDGNFPLKKNIILMGDNGHGKTTIASKLAVYLSQEGKKVAVIHQDPFRYGSYQQLMDNLASTAVSIYKDNENIKDNYDYHIIDTAGFSSWNSDYEKNILNYDGSYIFVGSCLLGAGNFNLIERILKKINIDGIIITNCDGEVRSGLFLSASYLIKKPILFISDNETIVGDEFNPAIIKFEKESLLKRLVGLYDETGFQKAVDKISKKNSGFMDRMLSGVFDYETMEEFLEGIVKNKFNGILGSLGNLGTQNDQQKAMMKKMLLVIQSMTKKEKQNPNLLESGSGFSRINRIARGTHMNPMEVANYIQSINMMIGTFSNFSGSAMADLEQMTDVEEMKEKFSDPNFLKKYINNEKENISFNENISFDEKNIYNNNIMSDEEKNNPEHINPAMNPFAAGGEIPEDMLNGIKMIKQMYTPAQLVQTIKMLPKEMLKNTPFGSMDPKMMDMILTEQNIQMLYDMVK